MTSITIDKVASPVGGDGIERMEDHVTEYVDHQHEHFVAPVTINRGNYMLPQAPAYDSEIHAQSLQSYNFPDGLVWNERSKTGGSY